MKKIKQSPQTKRVIEVIEILRQLRAFRNYAELARECKFSQPNLSMVLNSYREAPDALILSLHTIYNVSIAYISSQKLPKFTKEPKIVKEDPLSINAINKRVDYIINDISKTKNIPKSEIDKKIKLTHSFRSQLYKSDQHLIPSKYIRSLGKYYKVSANWILFEKGDQYM
jgi:hypothetical protein